MVKTYSIEIEGCEYFFEIGKLATQATSSVVSTCGNSKVLSTLCIGKKVTDFPIGEEFAPLTCEYRERSAAAGKIPGGFFKREGKLSDNEVLVCRLIDRPIRALIPKGYFYDTQIISLVLSADKTNPTDMLALNASAVAFLLSPIPKKQPLAAVRVCKIDGKLKINPSMDEIKNSSLNIVVAGSRKGIIMLEGEACDVNEKDIMSAIEYGYGNILRIIDLEEKILTDIKPPDENFISLVEIDEILLTKIRSAYIEKYKVAFEHSKKKERNAELEQLREQIINEIIIENPDCNIRLLSLILQKVEREVFELLIQSDRRFDGRSLDEIREISCEIGLLPRAHGSALFNRGETQALATVTLGTKFDQQIMNDLYEEYSERFLVHYNFLPFSVEETTPLRATTRREIGHGALAKKALQFIIPNEGILPHTIRIVSDILSSNGSTSMATVCAGSLALMDAGIPVKKHIAGVALGLITINNNQFILTDIIGAEDRYGEMDFKICGSLDGITALQLDVKNDGLSFDILKTALEKAKNARNKILDIMKKCIETPRQKISQFAPQIKIMPLPQDKIGLLIGPGGKTIRQIQDSTSTQLEIDFEKNELFISSIDEENINKAIDMVNELIGDLREGKVYKVRVKSLKDFGAIVATFSGVEGMIHISEISNSFVRRIDDYLSVGQIIDAVCVGKDEFGRGKFSIRQLQR